VRQLPGAPRQQPKSTQGPSHRVPCPHCGQLNDFRNLESQQLLDTGHQVTCRNENGEGCGRLMQVVAVQTIKMIAVKPMGGFVRQGQADPRQASTLSPAQMRRLLR